MNQKERPKRGKTGSKCDVNGCNKDIAFNDNSIIRHLCFNFCCKNHQDFRIGNKLPRKLKKKYYISGRQLKNFRVKNRPQRYYKH